MTLDDRQLFLQLFFSSCLAITKVKGADYNPDDIPLLEVLETAVDADISIEAVLWVYLRKHESAIKRYLRDGHIESESITERLRDAVNYHGLIAYYVTMKPELHRAWRDYWGNQACEYESGNLPGTLNMVHDNCQRCKTLSWLERRAFDTGLRTSTSRSTPKAQD